MKKQIKFPKSVYFSLFAISGGVFLFQIILSSILGFVYQHDFRLLGIMFGYIGFGLGGLCVFWFIQKHIAIHRKVVLLAAILLTVTGLLPFVMLRGVNLPIEVLSPDTFHQATYALMLIVSVAHFILAGFVVSSLYTITNKRTFHLYFYDLLGAGVMGIATLILVDRLGIFFAIPVIFLANAVGCIGVYLYLFKSQGIGKTIILSIVAIIGLIIVSRTSFQAVCNHNYEIVRSKSNSFSMVQLAKYGYHKSYIPFQIIYNCNLTTGGFITKDINILSNITNNYRNIPFMLDRAKNVLILGSGAGYDIHLALLSGAEHVQAVEINPLIVEFANSFPETFGHSAYQEMNVTTAIGDGVSYVAQSKNTYDLILLAFVKGNFGSPLVSNAIPSPSGMFTIEAISGYIKALRTQGTLAIIHLQPFSRIFLNTLATLLKSQGKNPESHIAVITTEFGSDTTEVILFKQSPFTREERDRLRELSTLYHVLYQEKLIAELIPSDAYVLTNDRPFILRPDSSNQNNEVGNNLSFDDVKFVPAMRFVPQLGLFLAISILILIVCVVFFFRQFGHVTKRLGYPLYCIGMSLGLAAFEFVFMYKSTVIIGNPTYAHLITLGCVLFGAALGSITLARFAKRNIVALGVTIIGLMGAITICFYTIAGYFPLFSPMAKILILTGMMLPVSYLSGAFFPYILEVAGKRYQPMIPWIWGIDAVAFITSGLLLQFVVLAIGINASMFFGLAGYLLVLLSIKYIKS